jgi:hypothetical protein
LINSACFTTPPRAVLMKYADSFISCMVGAKWVGRGLEGVECFLAAEKGMRPI